jgi:ABC-type Na+ efflux pump permease subunit
MPPVLLIAEREFRTYVATLSFWLSLAIAPLAAGAALFFSSGHPPPAVVSIQGGDRAIARSAAMAIEEAGRLEGKSFILGQGGASLVISRHAPRLLDVTFSEGFPLSPLGRSMVRHVIERDLAQASAGAFAVREKMSGAAAVTDVAKLSRLATMTMLWLTLTGSLGMLLQAVVRERANRALESLLASAEAWQIVAGKILGVGAVSLLVLASWLGSAAVFSFFLPPESGLVAAVLANLARPLTLFHDAFIYICAFAFYGATTVMLGAMARDSAAAQNAVRPMFVVLLAGFFAALTTAGKSAALSWLVWVPPFTPFVLLANSPDGVPFMSQTILLGFLLVAALAMQFLGARLLSVTGGRPTFFSVPGSNHNRWYRVP